MPDSSGLMKNPDSLRTKMILVMPTHAGIQAFQALPGCVRGNDNTGGLPAAAGRDR